MNIKEPLAKEIHAHTILQVVIAALILWVGATVSSTSTTVAVMASQIDYLAGDMDELNKRVRDLENGK